MLPPPSKHMPVSLSILFHSTLYSTAVHTYNVFICLFFCLFMFTYVYFYCHLICVVCVVVDSRFFSLFPVFTVFTVICPRVSGGGLFSLLCGDVLKSCLVSYCIASLVSDWACSGLYCDKRESVFSWIQIVIC